MLPALEYNRYTDMVVIEGAEALGLWSWRVYYFILWSCCSFCLAIICLGFSCLLRLCLESQGGGLILGNISYRPPGRMPSHANRRLFLQDILGYTHPGASACGLNCAPHLCLSGLGNSNSAATRFVLCFIDLVTIGPFCVLRQRKYLFI